MREAQRSGRFVDLAVHSFVAAMPPSRLVVPEGVSVDFVRRQIQYRVEVHTQLPFEPCPTLACPRGTSLTLDVSCICYVIEPAWDACLMPSNVPPCDPQGQALRLFSQTVTLSECSC